MVGMEMLFSKTNTKCSMNLEQNKIQFIRKSEIQKYSGRTDYKIVVFFEKKQFEFSVFVDETSFLSVASSSNDRLFEKVGQYNRVVYTNILKAVYEFHNEHNTDFPLIL